MIIFHSETLQDVLKLADYFKAWSSWTVNSELIPCAQRIITLLQKYQLSDSYKALRESQKSPIDTFVKYPPDRAYANFTWYDIINSPYLKVGFGGDDLFGLKLKIGEGDGDCLFNAVR